MSRKASVPRGVRAPWVYDPSMTPWRGDNTIPTVRPTQRAPCHLSSLAIEASPLAGLNKTRPVEGMLPVWACQHLELHLP